MEKQSIEKPATFYLYNASKFHISTLVQYPPCDSDEQYVHRIFFSMNKIQFFPRTTPNTHSTRRKVCPIFIFDKLCRKRNINTFQKGELSSHESSLRKSDSFDFRQCTRRGFFFIQSCIFRNQNTRRVFRL